MTSNTKILRDDENSTNQIDEGDGTLANPGDRKIIGNDALRMQYGVGLGVNYKGFDLSILLQGVGKNEMYGLVMPVDGRLILDSLDRFFQ